MPCYSTIRGTKLRDADKLTEALKALGFEVRSDDVNSIRGLHADGTRIAFSRYSRGDTFNVDGDTDHLVAISRKYAEVGVRAWAKRSGYSIVENDGQKIRLVNRRS